MYIARTISELHDRLAPLWCDPEARLVFVPTMGNLHAGHQALVRRAHSEGSVVVVSVFVNPLQFSADEDFDTYPRTWEADKKALQEWGVDAIFAPDLSALCEDIYSPSEVIVELPRLGRILCGITRPHFFAGVAQIVIKLLNIVRPDVVVFGQKDFQQVLVVRSLIRVLNIPVQLITVPTVRAEDGLALSSRNRYLSKKERAVAPELYHTLCLLRDRIANCPDFDYAQFEEDARQMLMLKGFRLDYCVVRYQEDLRELGERQFQLASKEALVVLAAVYLGSTRLIDNVFVEW